MQFANVNAFAQPILMQRQQQAGNALAAYGQGVQSARPNTSHNAFTPLQGPPGTPQGGDAAARIRAKLMQRGLPAHIADGFVANMRDESGLNPGINEISPLVPGSRGGFGLYQLTGPRRRAFEAYAGQKGVPLDDEDAQLDFLMEELRTTESRAAKNIFSAQSAGDAAIVIVNDFLRPAPEHRASRSKRYAGLQGSAAPQQSTNIDFLSFLGL